MGRRIRIQMRGAIARCGRIMRLGTPLLLAMLLALLLAACGAGGVATRPSPTPTAAAEAQDLIPPPAETAPTPTTPPPPPGTPPAPSTSGRVILVSLSRQQLFAYDNGKYAFTIMVETGRPELPTPTGVYHIFLKNCSDRRWTSNLAPTIVDNVECKEHDGDGFQEMFTSPWPSGSPYWYAPTHINYAMKFREGGFYLHDAWWHEKFGPGGNLPHQLANGEWETGSHGCVGMPIADAEKLYAWAPLGTTVYVRWGV